MAPGQHRHRGADLQPVRSGRAHRPYRPPDPPRGSRRARRTTANPPRCSPDDRQCRRADREALSRPSPTRSEPSFPSQHGRPATCARYRLFAGPQLNLPANRPNARDGLYEPVCDPLLDRLRLALRLRSSVQHRIWVSRLLIAPAGWVLPPSQIARRSRRKSIWETAISRSRPAARSSATASRLNAAGPAPARTAARTAPADGNSSIGGACCTSTPNAPRNATASESRMPARASDTLVMFAPIRAR